MAKGYIEKVKKRLYIASPYYDEEIKSLVEAARTDMIESGVDDQKAKNESDEFVLSAVVAFVKAQRGNDSTESERYMKQYSAYLFKLTMADTYRRK